jgi:mannosyltransferase
MDKKQIIFLLVLALFLGTFLRFFSISTESFWLDEGATALTLKKYSPMEILNNIQEKGNILPEYFTYDDDLPLYPLILSGWSNIFGISEFSLRAFSALLGSLSLILVFYLARYLFDDKVALLSTFLASVNLTLIWYSQEARQYSYLLFLSLLSVIFLLRFLKEGDIRYMVGLIVADAFLIYSHFPWIIFIAFEGAYALFVVYKEYADKRKLNKKVIVAFLIIGMLYLPIIGRAIFSQSDTVSLYDKPDIKQLAEFGVQLSTWLYPGVEMRQKMHDLDFSFSFYEWAILLSVVFTALLMGLLFIGGIIKILKRNKSDLFVMLMFFLPIIMALAISFIHPTITVFQLKQLIYVIPPFLIIASVGILRSKLRNVAIAAMIILSIAPVTAYYANVDKQQFREAAEFLPKGEPILVNIETAQVAFKYYYGESGNVIGIKDLDELKSYLNSENPESFWVMFTFTKYSDPKNNIKRFLDENYLVLEKKDFFDIELIHYKKS